MFFVLCSCDISRLMVWWEFRFDSMWCSLCIIVNLLGDSSSLFLWVLEGFMLIVGKICCLVILWFSLSLVLLVFLNFLKMIVLLVDLVLIIVVVMMVSDLFFLMLCVVFRKCLGGYNVVELILLDRIWFDVGDVLL